MVQRPIPTVFPVRKTIESPRAVLFLVVDVPVGRVDPTGAVLGYVLDMPVIVHVKLVVIPVVAQMQILMVSPQSFPSCSTLIRWSTFVGRSCTSRVQTWRRQPSSHSCSSSNFGLVVACPLCATTGAGGR